MKMSDLDFLIIGATKSATTWLQRSLQADAAVSMPNPELHYFSREFDRGDAWYLAQFPADAPARLAGEKSNSYLEDTRAAGRIRDSVPGVKLVVQLRNPVERAYSDYCMMYRRGELSRDIAHYLDPRNVQATRLISAGLYHRQLQVYYDSFPAENILVTLYDSVQATPREHLAEVRLFVGLPADDPGGFVHRRPKDKSTPMLGPRLRRMLQPAKPAVEPLRQYAFFRRMHAAIAGEIRYSPLTTGVRQRLAEYYASDVEALGKAIGRDLSPWLLVGDPRPPGRETVNFESASHPTNSKSQGFN